MAIKIDTILKIQELKLAAEEAYEKYHEEVQKVFDREGESSHAGEIEEDDDRNKYIRLTLTDNINKLKNGENVVGISMTRPIACKISLLKTKPKELK